MRTQTGRTEAPDSGSSAFETIREAADAYFNSGKPLYITAKDICKSIARSITMSRLEIESYDPSRRDIGPYIIDLRNPDSEMHELYYCGHLPGAVNIPWRKVTQLKTVSSLPKDRQIVVYSNTGQTGGQVAAILSLMGYDAVNLKWGITSWTNDETAAPERYSPSRDILWQNQAYRSTVTNDLEPEVFYDLPEIHSEGRTASAIIWNTADDYVAAYKSANISASALYDPMFTVLHPLYVSPYDVDGEDLLVLPFGAEPGEHDEQFEWPFILDVRKTRDYDKGHIPACVHIPAQDIFKIDNLKRIPPDRKIIVVSGTGHTSAHVVALLNLLGYDAVNLKWGMTGWCPPSPATENEYFSQEKDCMGYPVVKGWVPGRATECKG